MDAARPASSATRRSGAAHGLNGDQSWESRVAARSDTWGSPADRATLAMFAAEVADRAPFRVCAVEVLRTDGMLEFVAVHNNPEAAEALLGTARPYDLMAPAYERGQTYGALTFIAREWHSDESSALLDEFGFVPSFATRSGPQAWRVQDIVMAKLADDRGRLRVILHLDEPTDGRRPDGADLERLSEELRPLFTAVVNTVEREELVKRVRYADLTRRLIRRVSDTMSLDELLEAVSSHLREGFDAERLTLYLRDAHGFQLRMGRGNEISDALYEALGSAIERAWRAGVVVIAEPTGVWGDEQLAAGHEAELCEILGRVGIGTLVLVPVGTSRECLGSLVIIRAPGSPRWTGSESEAAIDVGRDLGRAVLNARAHEKEHELNVELRRLDEYRSQLISTVSHELKNPIGVILGHLEMIEPGSDAAPELVRSLGAIRRGALRLDDLAADLLLLGRFGDPDNVPDSVPLDLADVVRECVEFAQVVAERAEVEVVVEPASGDTVVVGDRAELSQVVGNLVSNAIKYSDPGGQVRLSARRQGRWVTVECSDSGLGISVEDQRRLFTEFFRSTNGKALRRPGTGLGLAILKRVVERHGGQVSVTSELGAGTTFLVTLPAECDEVEGAGTFRGM